MLDHFLIEFIQKKVPKHFTLKIQGAVFNLYKYFHESLAVAGKRTEEMVIGTETVEFTFDYFKVAVAKLLLMVARWCAAMFWLIGTTSLNDT